MTTSPPDIIAVDPGRCTGIAAFLNGKLTWCDVTTIDGGIALAPGYRLVIEIPQVYRAAQSPGDPNDLIKVAIEAGQWIERANSNGCPITKVLPSEWKGQVPKPVHNRRVLGLLSEVELDRVPKMCETKRHNMIDAIGLGLFALGRLRR